MANKDGFQRYLDAGIAFTTITRARAEELVHELVQSGEFPSEDARAKVEELIERTRNGRQALVTQVRQEVSRQLEGAGITNLEELAKQVAALLGRTAEAGRAATAGTEARTTKASKKAPGTSGPTKGATRPAPAKKTTATKAAAKKSPARKAAATNAAGTKAPAKKASAPRSSKRPPSGAPAADRPAD